MGHSKKVFPRVLKLKEVHKKKANLQMNRLAKGGLICTKPMHPVFWHNAHYHNFSQIEEEN